MTDLLVLAILFDGEFTLYKIRQQIKSNFYLFLSASFGSIHPAVKKLEKNGFISVKQKMSRGGQKSSTYFITNEGKNYFKEIMTSEIAESPLFSNQLINIKIMLLDKLDADLRKASIEKVKRYYELHLLSTGELLETLEFSQNKKKEKNFFQIKLLKHYADKISREISWIEGLS